MGRRKKIEDLWDKAQRKFIVWVIEATNLSPRDSNGLADPYVKIQYGKITIKTTSVKKDLSPKFSERDIFFLEPNGVNELTLEVWDRNSIASDKFMGMYNIGKIEAFSAESVQDKWFDLHARPGKKEQVSGRLHLRFLFSKNSETRPVASARSNIFTYDTHMSSFQTGDLILYDGFGIIPATTKISSNSNYSNAGMILKLPNKWTQKDELYLLEISRNIDSFLDAFKEVPSTGICIFRFYERIHQLHATSISWAAINPPLSSKEEQQLIESVGKEHRESKPISGIPSPMLSVLLDDFDKNILKASDFCELTSSDFIGNLLKSVGRNVPDGTGRHPSFFMALNMYKEPIVIRNQGDVAEPLPSHLRFGSRSATNVRVSTSLGFYGPPPKTSPEEEGEDLPDEEGDSRENYSHRRNASDDSMDIPTYIRRATNYGDKPTPHAEPRPSMSHDGARPPPSHNDRGVAPDPKPLPLGLPTPDKAPRPLPSGQPRPNQGPLSAPYSQSAAPFPTYGGSAIPAIGYGGGGNVASVGYGGGAPPARRMLVTRGRPPLRTTRPRASTQIANFPPQALANPTPLSSSPAPPSPIKEKEKESEANMTYMNIPEFPIVPAATPLKTSFGSDSSFMARIPVVKNPFRSKFSDADLSSLSLNLEDLTRMIWCVCDCNGTSEAIDLGSLMEAMNHSPDKKILPPSLLKTPSPLGSIFKALQDLEQEFTKMNFAISLTILSRAPLSDKIRLCFNSCGVGDTDAMMKWELEIMLAALLELNSDRSDADKAMEEMTEELVNASSREDGALFVSDLEKLSNSCLTSLLK
eukprot:TRINITY_DN3160_c0_g1_i1.p1 TRINITY_DN3160_c0_g1~~TRINITY_DN3160_c0_g1_i1.p1  ORF type:complete len:810 (+),score=196.32 TRINITY_DN3160_c0_g1_i1:29-2458(+)